MADFWNDWGSKKADSGPIAPGEYIVRLDSLSLSYSAKGPRTELVLVIEEEQPFAGRLVWCSWPHIPEKFGWLARMAWDAFGCEGRPEGDSPEQVFLSVAKILGDCEGFHCKATLANRTREWQGEVKTTTQVKSLAPCRPQAAQQPEQPAKRNGRPQQDGGEYGGKPGRPQW